MDEEREDPNPRALPAPVPQPKLALTSPDPDKPETYVRCSHCDHVVQPFYPKCPRCEGDRNRARHDRLAERVAEIKEDFARAHAPEDERRWMHELAALGHPNAQEFFGALKAKRK